MTMLIPTLAAAEPLGRATVPGNLELLRTALLDFSTPVAQPFPVLDADFDALGVGRATYVWPCEESVVTAGLKDYRGGKDLATVTGAPLVGQRLVGAYYRGSMFGKKAVEATANGNRFSTPDTALLQADAGVDWGLFVVYRRRRAPAARVALAGKFSGSVGWQLWLDTGGRIELEWRTVDTTLVTTDLTAEVVCDGALHAVQVRWKNSERRFYISTSEHDPAAETSILVTGDSLVNATAFGILGAEVQIGYMCGWAGADAAALGWSTFATLWRHGELPSSLITTYENGAPVGDLVARDATLGDVVALSSDSTRVPQFRYGWSPNLPGTKLGAAVDFLIENQVTWSEDLDQWTNGAAGATVAALARTAPSGLKCASRITQSALNGHRKLVVTGLDAETDYTLSLWFADDTAHSFSVQVLDGATETTQRALFSFAAPALPKYDRGCLQFTTGAGETSVVVRIYGGVKDVDTDKSVVPWGIQLMTGDWTAGAKKLMSYAATFGAARFGDLVVIECSSAAGALVKSIRGAANAVYEPADDRAADTGRYLIDGYKNGAANASRVRMLLGSTGNARLKLQCSDSGGTLRIDSADGSAVTAAAAHTARASWDSTKDIPGHSPANGATHHTTSDGGKVVTEGANVTWTALDEVDRLRIGMDKDSGFPFDGRIQEVRVYSKPLPILAS